MYIKSELYKKEQEKIADKIIKRCGFKSSRV